MQFKESCFQSFTDRKMFMLSTYYVPTSMASAGWTKGENWEQLPFCTYSQEGKKIEKSRMWGPATIKQERTHGCLQCCLQSAAGPHWALLHREGFACLGGMRRERDRGPFFFKHKSPLTTGKCEKLCNSCPEKWYKGKKAYRATADRFSYLKRTSRNDPPKEEHFW